MTNRYFSALEEKVAKVIEHQEPHTASDGDHAVSPKMIEEGLEMGEELRSIAITLAFTHAWSWLRRVFLLRRRFVFRKSSRIHRLARARSSDGR
jgi:hypothetical protein